MCRSPVPMRAAPASRRSARSRPRPSRGASPFHTLLRFWCEVGALERYGMGWRRPSAAAPSQPALEHRHAVCDGAALGSVFIGRAMSIKAHAAAVLALMGSSVLAGCGAASPPKPAHGGHVVAVIASVREELRTDRIVGADLRGSRLKVTLRHAAGPGEATISLWYGKLLAQAVANRLAARGVPKVSSAVYVGASETYL